ncbi:MAG: hypothetical protein KGQ94_15460 [Alphaproteobacteria bacterium]|nr:hypothetical protein [Alphaproteobacteria bacterium]
MSGRIAPVRIVIPAAIIAAGFVFSLAANWPGHLSYDSVIQLLEGRTGIYANWHPPVMCWMLGIADALLPGAGLFVIFDTVLAFGALAAFLALGGRAPSWAAAAVALLCIVSPQFLIYPAIVWKDVLFAAASVAGFAALAHAARRWPQVGLRFALLIGGFALFVLATLARQNGILTLLGAAVALGWIAGKAAPAHPWRSGALYGAGALLISLAAGGICHWALALRVTGELGPASQIRLLQSYDIIGAVTADPGLALSQLAERAPKLEAVIRREGPRVYSAERNDTLAESPALMQALNDAQPADIGAQWWRLVLGHPWLYLKVRWAAFRWVVLTPRLEDCHPYYFGINGPAKIMAALGYARRWDSRDQALADYAHHFVSTPLLSHGFYLALALAMLVLLLRRRRPADIAIAAMLASALAFVASFFVISLACDYRYLYALDLSALTAALYLACEGAAIFHRHE